MATRVQDVLSDILKTYDRSPDSACQLHSTGTPNSIQRKMLAKPHKRSHFFRVHHAVQFMFDSELLKEEDIAYIPFGYFMDLCAALGSHDNLIWISTAWHKEKQIIPINDYLSNESIRTFLQMTTMQDFVAAAGLSVMGKMQEVVKEMANRPGKYAFLTRRVGQHFADILGWPHLKPTEAEMLEAGDFADEVPWEIKIPSA